MTDYYDIANGIKTILDTVTELKAVYANEPDLLEKYPAAAVLTRGHRDSVHDTAANRRNYIFNIRIYYRADILEDAENILRKVVDKVLSALEADITLGGTCDFHQATNGDWDYANKDVPVRVAVLTIEATVRRNRV